MRIFQFYKMIIAFSHYVLFPVVSTGERGQNDGEKDKKRDSGKAAFLHKTRKKAHKKTPRKGCFGGSTANSWRPARAARTRLPRTEPVFRLGRFGVGAAGGAGFPVSPVIALPW